MLNRIVKSKKNVLIYLMITLIPAITISHFIAQHKIKEHDSHYLSVARDHALLHANDIERLIGETSSGLDMLATLININPNDLYNVKEILMRTHVKDVRFSGFYWANPEGDLVIGTNEPHTLVNVYDREYFQEALRTGKHTISPAHLGRVTGRFIITIAVPVFQNEEVKGVLLGSLRVDKIKEVVQSKINNEIIFVSDDTGQTLIQSNSSLDEDQLFSHAVELESVPWTVRAYVPSEISYIYERAFLINLGMFLIVTHIFFLLFQYYLLRQRVKLEQEQNERQKVELVENLAASTAHEIRNPLTGIKGLIQLLSKKYKDKKDQLYFKIILEEVNRINSIVSELLLLGKPTAHTLKIYNANDIVKEIEPIIESEANYSSVHLSIRYSTHELPISCVKDHLKQVILNLIKNSLDAVGTDGEVIILLEKNNNKCMIKVIDNGMGMPENVLQQVFNPFFTMKENGTGLGLAVCRRIIQSYAGKITIKSTPNEGTEVELIVPLADD